MKDKVGTLILVQVEVRTSEVKSDGGTIRSRSATEAYREGHDRIFKKESLN